MQIWNVVRRIIFFVRIALLILLFVFFLTPLFRQPLTTLNNADLQRARVERIAKDAMILQYRPVSEHAQVFSELQNTLPLWQQEQASLANFPDNQVQLLLLQSNSDFTSITRASQAILATPDNIDPIQVAIIVQHEHDYAVTIGQIETLMQQDIAIQSGQFILIELVIVVLSVVLTIFSGRTKAKKQEEVHAGGTQ